MLVHWGDATRQKEYCHATVAEGSTGAVRNKRWEVSAVQYLEVSGGDQTSGRLDIKHAAQVRLKVEAGRDIALI